MPELQEEAIAARGGEGGGEADGVVVFRGVHVQEGQVALAQRHEVSTRPEIGLGVNGRAGLGDREAQPCLGAGTHPAGGQAHRVAARGGRDGLGPRQRAQVRAAVHLQVARERERLAVVREVGEQPVGPAVVEAQRRRPCAVGLLLGVQVLEAGQVAADDDEVHPLLVLDVEVAHGPATVVDDPEAHGLRPAREQRGILDDQAQAVLGHA